MKEAGVVGQTCISLTVQNKMEFNIFYTRKIGRATASYLSGLALTKQCWIGTQLQGIQLGLHTYVPCKANKTR